jgi:flagellar protein FliO/FliZ
MQSGYPSSIGWSLFCMIAIIGVILILAWWIKQTNFHHLGKANRFKLQARYALGAREQLVIMEVDNRCLLLGVTAHSIQVLDHLDSSPLSAIPAPPVTPPSFSSLLDRLCSRSKAP